MVKVNISFPPPHHPGNQYINRVEIVHPANHTHNRKVSGCRQIETNSIRLVGPVILFQAISYTRKDLRWPQIEQYTRSGSRNLRHTFMKHTVFTVFHYIEISDVCPLEQFGNFILHSFKTCLIYVIFREVIKQENLDC